MMPADLSLYPPRAVGELLQSLLSERDEYRVVWSRHQRRTSGSALNQAAVAQVIALHLWESGERPDSQERLPRILKDRVRRALVGEVVSSETLNWFIDAFDMPAEDAERLRGLWHSCGRNEESDRDDDQDEDVAASPAAEAIVNSLRVPRLLPLLQHHRTISVFEHRVIGPDGRPVSHQTIRAIKACDGVVRSYPCSLMPGASKIRVRRGGKATVVKGFDQTDPMFEIELTRPLLAGQTTSLQYDIEFDSDCAPSTEYRCVAHARADNLDLVVQFDPSQPPRRLWWAIWDDHRGGTLSHQEPVVLDSEGSAHRFLRHLENAAVGFRWDW
jgi:hypothetical protein